MTSRRWFALSLLLLLASLTVGWLLAPDRVPLHYGPSGDADRIGSRERWLVESATTGVVIAGLFAGLARWMTRIPVRYLNVPNKDFWATPEHEGRLRAMMASDLLAIGGAAVSMMSLLFLSEVVAGRRGEFGLPWVFWLVVGSFVAGVLVFVAIVVPRRYAADE